MDTIPLLERRRIEAQVLIPLIRAFEAELGRERAHAIVRETIGRLACEQGREVGAAWSGTPIEKVEMLVPRFQEGGALDVDVVRSTETSFHFDVTRCAFAELYRELGAPDLGALLSCARDFELARGLSPDLELERRQTILGGASHCDFRFDWKRDAPAGKPGGTSAPKEESALHDASSTERREP